MFPDLEKLAEKLDQYLKDQRRDLAIRSRSEVAGWIFSVLMQQSPLAPTAWSDEDLAKYVALADRAAGLLIAISARAHQ